MGPVDSRCQVLSGAREETPWEAMINGLLFLTLGSAVACL